MNVIAKIILYPLFALFTFAVFLLVFFPYNSLKDKIMMEINENLGGKYEVSIDSFEPSPFSRIHLEKVTLVGKGKGGGLELLSFDELDVKVSLVSLIMGMMQIEFDGKQGKGSLSGSAQIDKNHYLVRMNINDFDLTSLQLLKSQYGVDMDGQLGGKIDLDIYPSEPLRNKGIVDLKIQRLKMAKSNVMNLLDLPEMDLASSQDSVIKLAISNGNIQVQRVGLKGQDLDFSVKGKVYFARKLVNYRLNLRGKFQFPATITPQLPFLMLLDKQKGPDGSYPLTITGRLSKPNVQVGEFKLPI